ncbi:MAG: hypothetical protein KDB07_04020 [Planctomycetes bacterium]|nr:hypothetical protein [Planctomycetota bacterium]
MAELRSISKEERDVLLDQVLQETKRWAKAERKRIDAEAEFLKRALTARAGTAKVSTANLEQASKITARSLNELFGIQVAQTTKS